MNKIFLTSVLCVSTMMTSVSGFAALQAGDTAPSFTADASFNGKALNLSLKDVLEQGPAVVYFYPSAYTNGCNVQAHTFAVKHNEFAAAGATIVGVSLDSIKRLNDFSADPDYCAGKFATVADADGKIAKSFDLSIREAKAGAKDTRGVEIEHGFTERTTFVVAPNGKIIASIGGMGPADNVAKALEVVQQLKSAKSPL